MPDMGIFNSLEISASGLAAQRLRLNVIANNIANASVTKTPQGGPYRRQVADFRAALDGPRILVPSGPASPSAGVKAGPAQVAAERYQVLPAGVEVGEVKDDPSELPMVYDPGHPDADEKGYVRMPNVNPVTEMMDLMSASRAYEANVTALTVARDMANKTLEIGR